MSQKPTVLMILDGFGLSDKVEGNAVKLADTPNLDKIFETCPWEKGYVNGFAAGLSENQASNSEVGHLNIGAGRIVYQNLTRVTKSIQDGDFYENPALISAMDNCKDNDRSLHLFCLLSDEGRDCSIGHLYALLEMAKRRGITNLFIHAFLHKAEVSSVSGKDYLSELEEKIKSVGIGKIATISGRYYAMDRDNHWERIEKAYNAFVFGEGEGINSVSELIERLCKGGLDEEKLAPIVIQENYSPVALIKPLDSIIFANLKPERCNELTRAFCDPDFNGFDRRKGLFPLTYVCLTECDKAIPYKAVAFNKQPLVNTFGEYISSLGLTQLRIAETEKYAHVTYFFNGGHEVPYPGEDRVLIPSCKVPTYDLQPEMSAEQITDKLVDAIKSQKYDVIIVNYANCDMVGHTGALEAAMKAVESIDTCIGRAVDALLSVNGQMLICADHGNSEKIMDEFTQKPFAAHTNNPVPFILFNTERAKGMDSGGKLCDIAPTLLELMNIPKPKEMTGRSLVI